MPHLVQGRPVPIDRLEIGGRRRNLDVVERRDIEGTIAADAEIDTGRPDQRLEPRLDHAGRRWRRLDGNVFGQTLALRRVEHGEALQEGNTACFFPCLAGAAFFVLGGETVRIDDCGATLAFADIAAERQRLAEGEPMLGRIAVLDYGAPENQNIDPGILTRCRGIPRHGERRFRRRRPPGLDPGQPPVFELADDLVGDVVVEIAAGAACARSVLSGHRNVSATGTGSLSPSPQPVTENPSALSLSGRCGGTPQKGSAETLARPQGKAFPSNFPLPDTPY